MSSQTEAREEEDTLVVRVNVNPTVTMALMGLRELIWDFLFMPCVALWSLQGP